MISLKVYGDLSGNQLKAVFANGAGEEKPFRSALPDYLGWKDGKASLEGIGEGSYTLQGFVVEQVSTHTARRASSISDKVAQEAASPTGV